MTIATLSQFRNQQAHYIAAVHREPVVITSRGAADRRAVLVSPEFYDRAMEVLQGAYDFRTAADTSGE